METGRRLTLIFDLEVGGDEGWGLPSDPSGEGLSAFIDPVVLDHLDLKKRERKINSNGHTQKDAHTRRQQALYGPPIQLWHTNYYSTTFPT